MNPNQWSNPRIINPLRSWGETGKEHFDNPPGDVGVAEECPEEDALVKEAKASSEEGVNKMQLWGRKQEKCPTLQVIVTLLSDLMS